MLVVMLIIRAFWVDLNFPNIDHLKNNQKNFVSFTPQKFNPHGN